MRFLIGLILSLYGCRDAGNLDIQFIEFYCSPTPDPLLDECMAHSKPKWVLNCSKRNGRARSGLSCRGYKEFK